MKKTEFFGYIVEVDMEATQNWYAQADSWGCSCGHCRNFLEHAKRNALPEAVSAALKELDIPAEKATYVSELYTDEEGIHYQFSYRLSGTILAELSREKTILGRCCHEPYPYGAPNFPEPYFDLEFWVTLHWILEEADR